MPLIKFGRATVLILHWRILCGNTGRGDHKHRVVGSHRALLAVVSFVHLSHSALRGLKSWRTAACHIYF